MTDPVPLDRYVAELQELVLFLRDEGHLLSSMDQHLLATWWERGYPLPAVLRAVHEAGLRLKNRKRPPRGLPLRSMRKAVEKEGEKALLRSAGAAPVRSEATAGPADGGDPLLDAALAAVGEALAQASAPRRALLEAAAAELEALGSLPEMEAFTGLLAVSRRYYDGLRTADRWGEDRRRLRAEEKLGDAARTMTAEALDATLNELSRRALREEDPVLDLDRLDAAP